MASTASGLTGRVPSKKPLLTSKWVPSPPTLTMRVNPLRSAWRVSSVPCPGDSVKNTSKSGRCLCIASRMTGHLFPVRPCAERGLTMTAVFSPLAMAAASDPHV